MEALLAGNNMRFTLLWAVLMSVEWDWFIAHFGDWGRFAAVPWQSSASPVLSWTIVFITQLFWASRCYILYNRSKFLFGCLLVGMIATFANFMWQVAVISQVPFNFALMEKLCKSTPTLSFILAGLLIATREPTCSDIWSTIESRLHKATDLAITGLTLWKIRNGANSYSSASQHGLKRLRNIVVEAAVPPAICGALNLIVFLVLGKKGMVAIGFALLTPSFYVWSMMFTLNSRPAIRRAFHASRHSDGDETLSTNFQFAKLQLSKLKSSDADIQLATANLNLVPEAPQLTKLPVGHVKESSGGGPATRDMRLSKEPADIV
ncbi:hypothetical protein FRB90_011188 [Tulasnella sp. 427]|nr:hypothetical protein FRB90_011188 [Tulasnella sp. 427]